MYKRQPVNSPERLENVPSESAAFNVEALSAPRILGNPDAPIKISEHSSFTCGACRAFHDVNYQKIKADFIDTGKAYLVFDDFPRNGVDVVVGAVARCVPDNAYFNFVQLVFNTQDQWSQNRNFADHIKQNAVLAGADAEQVDQCFDSKELR